MKQIVIGIGVLCAMFFVACGSSSSGGGGDSSTISNTVPKDLAIASPTAGLTASASISKMEDGPLGSDFESKKDALDALINATGECSLTMGTPIPAYAECYGPNVKYAGWPGGSTTDNLPSGDLGIWSETEGGTEACAAAKMNSLVDGVSDTLDYMIAMLGVGACAGKKASLSIPAVGSSIDLTSALSTYATLGHITVTSATLARETDVDSYPVYVSTIVADMKIMGEDRSVFIRLKHIPTADDNSTYKGKLSMYVKYDVENDAGGQGCAQNIFGTDQGGVLATTILYQKSSSTLTYELNNVIFCGTSANPFLDENGVDDGKYNLHPLNYAVATTNEDGWGDNWNYGLFEVDATTGLGTVVYAWQAGKNDSATRIFNMSVAADASGGTASGKAYAGHGNDVTDSANLGVIKGFICNYAGPRAPSHSSAIAANPKAQYQALERGATATQFTPTTSNIVYAPYDDCTASVNDGFTYWATVSESDTTVVSMTNNRTTDTSAVTPNFVNITDMVFTAPTVPTDVD